MQRFKRTIRLLMIRMLIAILLLTGCHRSVEHKPEVAVILKSMGSDYFRNMISGINTAANEFNLSVSISGPAKEESWESQNLLIKAAINRKVSAIVLSAVSYTETSEAIREAVRADIPVIVVDSDVDSHQVALRISTDNYEAGRSMGEYVLSRGGKRVALLNHDRQSENGQARERGVRAVLSERPEVTVYPTLNVDSDIISSKSGALKLLRDYPEADTLITFNEWTTLGMGYAMEELGSTDRVTAVGLTAIRPVWTCWNAVIWIP